MAELPSLTAVERARYEWQMWLPHLGEVGQQKLKAASVLISRIGGVGGTVTTAAYGYWVQVKGWREIGRAHV